MQYVLSHRLGKAAVRLQKKIIPYLQDLLRNKSSSQAELLHSRLEVSIEVNAGQPLSSYFKLVQLLSQHLLTRDGFKNTCTQLGYEATFKYIAVEDWLNVLASVNHFATNSSHLYDLAKRGNPIDDLKYAHTQWHTLLNLVGFSNINTSKMLTRSTKEERLQAWQEDFINTVSSDVWTTEVVILIDKTHYKAAKLLLAHLCWSYNSYNHVYQLKNPKHQIISSGTSVEFVFLKAFMRWNQKKESISQVFLTSQDQQQQKPNIVLQKI